MSAPAIADPRADRLGRFSWAMYDWANQPFFTLITTFIFAPYFVSHVVGDAVRGQALWGYGQAAAGISLALLAPVLGAIADAGGRRKPWIFGFGLLGAVSAGLLWLAVPGGGSETILLTLVLVAVATIGVEFSIVFNNAMLPGLVPGRRLGRLSGFGWGLGYVGGLVALIFVLLGFALPDAPLFGLDKASHEHDRLSGPLSGLWLVVFAIPLFLFTPDTATRGIGPVAATVRGLRALKSTLSGLRRHRNVALYLAARMMYYDGQSAIFAFGGIYAAGLFGWSITELGIFGIVLIVFAALGAFMGGWLDDKWGSRKTILVTLGGLIAGTLGIVSIGDGVALFVLPAAMPGETSGLFASAAERFFMAFGILVGFCGGPAQAASRTLMARLAPPQRIGEFFGLYALSGKATSFLAPLTVAALTTAYASQRAGLASILVFLIVGFGLLTFVREEPAA